MCQGEKETREKSGRESPLRIPWPYANTTIIPKNVWPSASSIKRKGTASALSFFMLKSTAVGLFYSRKGESTHTHTHKIEEKKKFQGVEHKSAENYTLLHALRNTEKHILTHDCRRTNGCMTTMAHKFREVEEQKTWNVHRYDSKMVCVHFVCSFQSLSHLLTATTIHQPSILAHHHLFSTQWDTCSRDSVPEPSFYCILCTHFKLVASLFHRGMCTFQTGFLMAISKVSEAK